MYIDTHCHLSIEDYDDIDLVVKENREAGIDKIIISGCTLDTIKESIDYAHHYDDVYVTIGFHPSEAKITSKQDIMWMESQLSEQKVVGIGEIGLDYHYGKENIDKQKALFREQMRLASKYNLPVVIHSRDATEDTIAILKEFPSVYGDIHCFSGSVETAKIYVSMGYYLGIGGVLTFKNSNLYKVIESIGINNILLETDSPYLTPEPFRGKKNSSKYLQYTAIKLSEVANVSLAELQNVIYDNTLKLFDLD